MDKLCNKCDSKMKILVRYYTDNSVIFNYICPSCGNIIQGEIIWSSD